MPAPVPDPSPTGDPLYPWPPHVIVDKHEAGPFLGLSDHQLNRARFDGVLPYYLHRGRSVGFLAADLYEYRDAMRIVKPPKPKVTRKRTAEHNATGRVHRVVLDLARPAWGYHVPDRWRVRPTCCAVVGRIYRPHAHRGSDVALRIGRPAEPASSASATRCPGRHGSQRTGLNGRLRRWRRTGSMVPQSRRRVMIRRSSQRGSSPPTRVAVRSAVRAQFAGPPRETFGHVGSAVRLQTLPEPRLSQFAPAPSTEGPEAATADASRASSRARLVSRLDHPTLAGAESAATFGVLKRVAIGAPLAYRPESNTCSLTLRRTT